MIGLLRNTDLLAGGGAAALFLAAVFPLGLPLPVALALALATYVGLRLALPKPGGAPADGALDEAAFAATLARCEEQVTAIHQFAGWAGFAGKPEVRARLLAIHRSARRVLDAIRQDPNKHGAAEQFLTGYLLPITDVLAQYVRLAGRELALARAELAALEAETLPLIERRLATLYEQIHSADLAALELDTKMLEYTFQPIEIAPKRYTTEGELPQGPEDGAPARGTRRRPGAADDAAVPSAKEFVG